MSPVSIPGEFLFVNS